MNNKIRAALLTLLTIGLTTGLMYEIIHHAHIIGILFFIGLGSLGVIALYTIFKNLLDNKTNNDRDIY